MKRFKILFGIIMIVGMMIINNSTINAAGTNHTVTYNGATYTYSDAGVLISVTDPVGDIDLAAFSKENDISLVSIGERVFNKAKNITSVNIPASVKIIGERAFFDCSALMEVTYEEGSELTTIGERAFTLDSALIAFHQKGDSITNEFVFPQGVSSFGVRALQSTKPVKVTLPEKVTQIPEGMFMYCSNLTTVEVEGTITSIGDGAFQNADINEIVIPESCTQIGANSFQKENYSGTFSVTIMNNNIVIGENAFPSTTIIYANEGSSAAKYAGDNGLAVKPISSGEQSADGDNEDKSNMDKLKQDDTTKENDKIENDDSNKSDTEDGKTKEETKSVSKNDKKDDKNTNSVNGIENKKSDNVNTQDNNSQTISGTSDNNNTASTDNLTMVKFEKGKYYVVDGLVYKAVSKRALSFIRSESETITELTVPDTVNINGIDYPVTKVANKACYKLSKLKTVSIGNNVTVIGKQAFMDCKKLKTVRLGKSITKLGAKCFCNDKKLKRIQIDSKKLKKIGKDCMKGTVRKKYKVPSSCTKKYRKMFTGK